MSPHLPKVIVRTLMAQIALVPGVHFMITINMHVNLIASLIVVSTILASVFVCSWLELGSFNWHE